MEEKQYTQAENQPIEMHVPNHTGGHTTHMGMILGVLLIVLVLILGGLFLWGSMLDTQMSPVPEPVVENHEPETPRAIADQQILETVSPSDDITMIDVDVNATNLDSLDADLNTIDSELKTVPP